MNETGVNDKGVDHSSVNFKPYILSVEESIKYCENIALIDPNCSAVSFSWKKKNPYFPTETVQSDASISSYLKSPL